MEILTRAFLPLRDLGAFGTSPTYVESSIKYGSSEARFLPFFFSFVDFFFSDFLDFVALLFFLDALETSFFLLDFLFLTSAFVLYFAITGSFAESPERDSEIASE